MPETEALKKDPTVVACTWKLKKDLERVVKEVIEEDDIGSDTIEDALWILTSLREFTVPDEFRCPISGELMKDPVVLASGLTFDRPYIQSWFKQGHRSCPKTEQVLSHTLLTPNYLVREMILQWCRKHGIELPKPSSDEEAITNADRQKLNLLLEKLSSSFSDQKESVKKLRVLTKKMPSFRALFVECPDAISRLLIPFLPRIAALDPDLQEDVVTIIFNVSVQDDRNKSMLGDNPDVIYTLVESLATGSMQTRATAAAALSSLGTLERNKFIIGEAHAMKPLSLLLQDGNLSAMRDAAGAIFKLCYIQENKLKAVHGGLVSVIIEKIMNHVLVDELVSILALISRHHGAIEAMVSLGAIPCLFNVIKETSCERNKENCVSILVTICHSDRTTLKELRDEENANKTISQVAQNGTPKARRKASRILEKLKVRYTNYLIT